MLADSSEPWAGISPCPTWGPGSERAVGGTGGHRGYSQSQKLLGAVIPPHSLEHVGVPETGSAGGILAGRGSRTTPCPGKAARHQGWSTQHSCGAEGWGLI